MTSSTRTVPAWDTTDRSGGAIAGLIMHWIGEGEEDTPQIAKPRAIKLNAKKGIIYCEPSNELVADGLDFENQLEAVMKAAVSYGLDNAFLFGSGVAQPLGIFNSSALVSVTREEAGTITYGDVTAMFSRMAAASVTRAEWVAHPSTIPALTQLSVQVGAGGTVIPVMTSNDGSFSILTRPVRFSELAKPLGTPGDLGLFDFSEYVIGLRKEVSIATSNGPGFYRDTLSFRVVVRVDGQPSLPGPITPPNSGATLSPFVRLV